MNKKEITLPSGIKAEIKEYAEAWILMDLNKQEDTQKFLIESTVLSLSGETKNVYSLVRDLSVKDFKALDKELQKLFNIEDEKK